MHAFCLAASLFVAQESPQASPSQASFPELALTLTLPALEGMERAADAGDEVRGSWSGKLGSSRVSIALYTFPLDEWGFHEAGGVTVVMLDWLREAPGIRIGWVVAAREHIELFRNFSSFGMGGVSRASQLYATELLELERVARARTAIGAFYKMQRERYGRALERLGLELFTGTGGFYHWGRLPRGLTGDAFNERLFEHQAGILPGRLCDMARRGDSGPLGPMMRFSFGPLSPESFEADVAILERCLAVPQPAGGR